MSIIQEKDSTGEWQQSGVQVTFIHCLMWLSDYNMNYLTRQAISMVETFSHMVRIKSLSFIDGHRSSINFAGSAYSINMQGHRLIGKEVQDLLPLVGRSLFSPVSAVIL